jgi:fumarate hydratase, class II
MKGKACRGGARVTAPSRIRAVAKRTRIERDSMGEMEVPADAYYGASTQRAVLNFPISGQALPRRFIRALGMVKRTAAQTNLELGLLARRRARAIAAAAQEVVDGKLDDQFPIDVYQTGSGTSTNTNANEVIANRATELLGGERGSKLVHPNDHVNLCQSSNDVIPTAIQLASAMAIKDELQPALARLHRALDAKSKEFWPVVKTGRTHLQDATPIRLGQEFRGYAGQIEESIRRADGAADELSRVPLGGTAVGTGINSHPQYARLACARLAKATGLAVRETSNHFHAQATLDALVAAHGAVRTIATSLWKIGSDVRLMGTGPVAGLGELRLPETQPGSSIMPGKVNPVIVESLLMVIARVYGNDATVLFSAQSGSFFELNVMMPVAGAAMLESITLLAAAARNFSERCVEGLQATDRGPELVERSPMLATALTPLIGYDEAAKLAKESMRTGHSIRQLARARGVNERALNSLLDLGKMTKPGLDGPGGGG